MTLEQPLTNAQQDVRTRQDTAVTALFSQVMAALVIRGEQHNYSTRAIQAAIRQVTATELLPHRRVALRSPTPISTRFVTDADRWRAEQDNFQGCYYRHSPPGEHHWAVDVIEQRATMERQFGLLSIQGHGPVSATVALDSPPGTPRGALIGWADDLSDNLDPYGGYVSVLPERITERTRFMAGDSYNLYAQAVLKNAFLSASEAAIYAGMQGLVPTHHHFVGGMPGELPPYIEALIVGGLDSSDYGPWTQLIQPDMPPDRAQAQHPYIQRRLFVEQHGCSYAVCRVLHALHCYAASA